jgi:uncharacterized Fe-S cluster protein YjdI
MSKLSFSSIASMTVIAGGHAVVFFSRKVCAVSDNQFRHQPKVFLFGPYIIVV